MSDDAREDHLERRFTMQMKVLGEKVVKEVEKTRASVWQTFDSWREGEQSAISALEMHVKSLEHRVAVLESRSSEEQA